MFWPLTSTIPETSAERDERISEFRTRMQEEPEVVQTLSKAGREPHSDSFCQRWLVSRQWDISAAVGAVSHHATWLSNHASLVPVNARKVPNALMKQNNEMFLQGFDSELRPVMLCNLAAHMPGATSKTERQEAIVWCMEHMIKLAERSTDGRCIIIFDLQGFTFQNLDTDDASSLVDILQKQYPERLHQLLIYEAPSVFWILWNLVWPFLTTATSEKVRMLSGAAGLQELHKSVPPSILPASLGGSGQLRPFPEAIASTDEDTLRASSSSEESVIPEV